MTDDINPTGFNPDADRLAPSELRVVLVCDVVESVRWMEQDEDNAVTRWQAFTQHVRSTIVPAHRGSVVKSTGDGLMIEFPTARGAVQAANALHAKALEGNIDPNPNCHLQLRTGIHETQARRDAYDLYGHGVNLAARITTLAGPGETIVSAPVRDHLTDSLDGDIEDMGECYLKHVTEPQRVYRVGAGGAAPILVRQRDYTESLYPTVVVIPFESRNNTLEYFAHGDLIADGVIAQLSRTPGLKVVSRLSSSALVGRDLDLICIARATGANYVVSGSYVLVANKIRLQVELSTAKENTISWSGVLVGSEADLLQIESELCAEIASQTAQQILQVEAQNVSFVPLPTLASYSLLVGAIGLMHRRNASDTDRAQVILRSLNQRMPRQALGHAWLAKSLVLAAGQCKEEDFRDLTHTALDSANRALQVDPGNSLALTINGIVQSNLVGNYALATQRYQEALQADPNNSLAWLYSSVLHSFEGSGEQACLCARRALDLSPIDPIKYLYTGIAASASLTNKNYLQAIELASDSLRLNVGHMSAWRVKTIAQVLQGQTEAARCTAAQMMKHFSGFSVRNFLSRTRHAATDLQQTYAQALASAGVPLSTSTSTST